MPPWTGPDAPPEIAERAGHRFCGVEVGPGPVDRAIRRCFVTAAADGTDIEFARIQTTVEGDPIATIYGFEPIDPPAFTMLSDSTQDAFGAKAWTVTVCRAMVVDPVEVLRLSECVEGRSFR